MLHKIHKLTQRWYTLPLTTYKYFYVSALMRKYKFSNVKSNSLEIIGQLIPMHSYVHFVPNNGSFCVYYKNMQAATEIRWLFDEISQKNAEAQF